MQKLKEFVPYTKKYLGINDAYAIMANAKALGINERSMVETSGAAIAENLSRKHRNDRITFVCGPGGKGAIGMAAARHLMDIADVQLAFVGNPDNIHNDSLKFNYKIMESIVDIEVIDSEGMDRLKAMLKKSDDVVDAIIGIGMHGRLDETLSRAIKAINDSKKYIISIDVPSGVNGDTGSKNISTVNPDLLLVIHKMKSFLKNDHGNYSVNVLSTGIPASVELITGPGDVMLATKPRFINANKYEHGTVAVLGGSEDYRGAPMLSGMAAEHALAALKTGSGYVTVISPEDSLVNEQRPMPELILKTISKKRFASDDVNRIKSVKHEAIVIGPGIKEDYFDYKGFSELIAYEKSASKWIVADAAALKMLSRYKNLIGNNMVLTPHIGEFKHLCGIDLSKHDLNSKIYTAIDFAKTYGCTLVLKGNDTIITDGTMLKINKAASPTLSTMGTGDVLAGIIASYISINNGSLFESAAAGVYVHTKIGEMLHEEIGLHATAYDVAVSIPKVIKEFDRVSY
ncbi:MAG: NAD(P)H-hydrate dehydratase [Methanothrix sp.]